MLITLLNARVLLPWITRPSRLASLAASPERPVPKWLLATITPLAPLPRRQTYEEGQPDVEQSPVWHLLSAPQLPPAQSVGFEHEPEPGGFDVPPSLQRLSEEQL